MPKTRHRTSRTESIPKARQEPASRAQARTIALGCGLLLSLIGTSAYLFWSPSAAEPFFNGLGTHSRKITTYSSIAQKYFDQGLAFLYGFKPEEAVRSFEAAAESDPQCPMAYWGIAMADARIATTWRSAGRTLKRRVGQWRGR